jgi:hypothetical protein
LLVVDEAQHLGPSAFEWLEDMANGPADAFTRFQICMLGQPELRMLINAADRARLRDLVTVERHLGPLDQTEIRLYIEHRLHRAGWTGRPEFEDAAFFEIFVFTAGVPRRINLLCHSLMLAACLEKQPRIDASAVGRAAAAIRSDSFPTSEVTEVEVDHPSPPLLSEALDAPRPQPDVARPDTASRQQPLLADVQLDRRGRPPHRRQTIVASTASVAIVLTLAGVAYVIDGQKAPSARSPVVLPTAATSEATEPGMHGADLPRSPRPASASSPAATLGVPAAQPASADTGQDLQVSAKKGPAALPTEASCSAPAVALGLCDTQDSRSTGRK